MKAYICYVLMFSLHLYQGQCQHGMHASMEMKADLLPIPKNFQSYPHVAGVEEDLTHPCYRSCSGDNQKKKKCFYKFKVESYVSMSKACYDCPHNLTDCFRPYCVALDGLERPLVTINRRLPGPSIQVCEGDEIIVDVENNLGSDSTTVHWHGQHQYGTPYMDGVPFLTQCPINPGTVFRYRFQASPAGTHFYHSHSGLQRDDGLFGALIVRSRDDAHSSLYDVDDPEHIMLLTDWFNTLTIEKFVNHFRAMHGNNPYNLLVNGFGKYQPIGKDNKSAYTPLYEFRVKSGLRYRFRVISSAIQSCPIEISVVNHTLLMIASDGQNIEPLEVDSFVIYVGERWDFVITANKPIGTYWVKYRGLIDCGEDSLSAYQVAVLRYDDATEFPNEPKDINYEFTKRNGVQLNKLNAAPGDLTTFYTTADVRSYKLIEEPSPYSRTPAYKFWFYFDAFAKVNDWFHPEDLYPSGAEPSQRLELPQMNNITLMFPNVPPLSQPDEVNSATYCNATSRPNCGRKFCQCTHILHISLGSLVEFILVDTGFVQNNSHPFHIHGHSFAVLGMEHLGVSTTLKAVQDLERDGKLIRNFINPPLKDSIIVPDGGYTVVRFVANNPGYWFFHCHISFHSELGMGLILHIGEKEHLPPVPPAFPKCGSWVQGTDNDLETEIDRWEDLLQEY